jgi:hypothetical protein
MSTHRFVAAAVLAGAVLASSGPADAHHSFAMVERDRHMLIEGTVTAWHFNNPHTWLYVEAPDADGAMQTWGFEGGAPVHAIRQGVTGQTFSYGEHVRVIMAPLRDGRPAGGICLAVKEDGSIAQPNDGACPADAVLERWRANGWLENASHLEVHPASD